MSPREVRWVEVRPFIRFHPVPHWSSRDAFRETHGLLVVQDKDSIIVKDSMSTNKAG